MYSQSFTAAAAVLLAGLAQGQVLINELSFGHEGRIDSASSGRVPNWELQGQPMNPSVLSNKIIITPPAPGNVRGATWAERPMVPTSWVTDVDFRATGPERGGGNLNIWLAKDGKAQVGMSSIYTVGKFDGLVLVVDMHAGSGGMIRGFLNDGSIDFKSRQVDELAFGHCLYSYRNRGSPSQIKLRQSSGNFRVEVDSQLCFETGKFSLPTGYTWGLTAATPDNPDSFEIFKFTVMEDAGGMRRDYNRDQDKTGQQDSQYNAGGIRMTNSETVKTGDQTFDDNTVPDQDAAVFQSSEAQFQDLHQRMQSQTHQLSTMYRNMMSRDQEVRNQHAELKNLLTDMKTDVARVKPDSDLLNRISSLESEVRGLRTELNRQIQANERSVKGFLTDHHASLSQAMTNNTPGHNRLILIIVGSQVLLVAGYILYMRRKQDYPKKYL